MSRLYRSIRLNSRYDEAHEIEVMTRIADALEEGPARFAVLEIFCDSKYSNDWTIYISPKTERWAKFVATVAERILKKSLGGYNGLRVRTPDDVDLVDLGADWWMDDASPTP